MATFLVAITSEHEVEAPSLEACLIKLARLLPEWETGKPVVISVEEIDDE